MFKIHGLNVFYNSLLRNLPDEFQFIVDVAYKRVDARASSATKMFADIRAVIGLASPLINLTEYVDIIRKLTESAIEASTSQQKKTKSLATELVAQTPDRIESSLEVLAREITYRWSPLIMRATNSRNGDELLIKLTHIAALRIVEFAIKNGTAVENCELLIQGLIEGSESSWWSKDLMTLNLLARTSSSTGHLTAEAFFSQTAYVTPDDRFWIHRDYKKEKPEGKPYGWVKFSKRNGKKGKLGANDLRPKYGYVFMPESVVTRYNYREHFPPFASKGLGNFLEISSVFSTPFRYVTLQKIIDYLKAIKSSPQTTPAFNDWLVQQYPKYHLHSEPCVAVFRGTIDGAELAKHDVSLDIGNFKGCDFSLTTFNGCELGRFEQALLTHCTFERTTVSGNKLDGANLSHSTVSDSQFDDLSVATLNLNFVKLVQSSFKRFSCTFNVNIDEIDADEFSRSTFSVQATSGHGQDFSTEIQLQQSRDETKREKQYRDLAEQHEALKRMFEQNEADSIRRQNESGEKIK